MNCKAKKAIMKITLTVIIVLFAITIFFMSLEVKNETNKAEAAVEDLAFTVESGIYYFDEVQEEWKWQEYNEGTVSQQRISFRFKLDDPQSNYLNILEFNYVEGTNYQQADASTDWKGDGENNAFLRPNSNSMPVYEDAEGKFYIWTFTITDAYERYVKFKATAATTSGSTGEIIIEEYVYAPIFHIVYDGTVNEADIKIDEVNVAYRQGSLWTEYNTLSGNPENIWISTEIRFEILSQNIKLGGTINERFYYSIDGLANDHIDKEWHPATENICILRENINGPVQFRVTDRGGLYEDIYPKSTQPSINVKMDIVPPTFDVDAETTIINENDEVETVKYDFDDANQWSYNEVVYIITPTAKGESPIDYEYIISGQQDWSKLTRNAGSDEEFYVLPLSNTTTGIKFRARSLANQTVEDTGKYTANIDYVQPIVSIEAYDKLNTEIKSFFIDDGEPYPEGEGYRVGYASDQLNFSIYNRNALGELIINDSALTCTFSFSYEDEESNLIEHSESKDIEKGDNPYFEFSHGVIDKNPIKNITYTIKIESRAGLEDEKTFTATILHSDFEIAVDLELISYPTNTEGWANAPIEVFIDAPVMDKYIFAYGISGTGYENFEKRLVWPSDSSLPLDDPDRVEDVSDDYADITEGNPGYLSPGMARFRIYISTSAGRERYYKIYAYNAAEDKSSNEENTPEIKLDMETPKVAPYAYIKGDQQIPIFEYDGEWEDDGEWTDKKEINIQLDWVNGNIELVMDSRALPSNKINPSGLECELMVDENIPDKIIDSELDGDDLPIGKFIYLAEIPEEQDIYEKTLIFRLTSGSGLQNFIYFDIKIDKRDIVLNSVYDKNNDEILLEYDEDSPVYTAITQPVCKEIEFELKSNHAGHFSVKDEGGDPFYVENRKDENGDDVTVLIVPVPLDDEGERTIEFRLESFAINAVNEKTMTSPYTLKVPYNCRTMKITGEVQQQPAQGYEKDENGWRNGPLSFLINLPAGESYDDYEYGIIILNNMTADQFYESKGLLGVNQKSDIYEYCTPDSQGNKHFDLIDGGFDFWGVDENGRRRFHNPIDPPNPSDYTEKCFYTGNLMVLAFNNAKYSSDAVTFFSDVVRVDNSIPDVTDLIEELNGEIDGTDVYNNDTIVLKHPQYSNRASIEYYYYLSIGEDVPSSIPTSQNLNDWSRFGLGGMDPDAESISIENEPTNTNGVTYYLYAINSLRVNNSNDHGERYTFFVDSIVPTFTVTFPEGEGSSTTTDIDGEQYNVFTFTWTEEINIKFSHTSNTSVYYWYSLDNMQTWIRWNDVPISNANTIFDFSENINSTMFFKMTNQAGSEVVHERPAVVRIDTRRPDFSLQTYVGGSVYDGGGYGSIEIGGGTHGLNLDDTSGQWSSSTVTIVIEIDPAIRNTSPVEYWYRVITNSYETQYVKTPSNIVINNRITFTTDRMDSFGRNNDAIIVVQARCPANSKVYTQAIRVKVDKVVPEFVINGEVKVEEDSSQMRPLYSGEWTNMEEVILSIKRTNTQNNVSNVRIVYYVGGSSLENLWPTLGTAYGMIPFTDSETVRVVARTDSSLTYEQVFEINIDTVPPQIESGTIVPSVTETPNTYYIDQPITFREENLKSAQYIVRKGDTAGFPLSQGHIIATNSVDNSDDSKGYVKIIIEDLAGNIAELEFYMIPFQLNINNLTLSQEDIATVDRYEEDLDNARGIDDSRRAYFENLIVRLRDRENTLRQEISGFQSYLALLSQKASYELKSDYREMNEYLTTYNNYAYYDQEWIQQAIIEGEYFAYFSKFQENFAALDKEMQRVELVEENTKKLPAINVVEVIHYNDILQVYDAYSDLSPDQKSVYATTLYNKLITLKRKCENLLLQDEDSGIKIDGNLAPGATIEVDEQTNFDDPQDTLLNTVDSDKPRTIVSINKIRIKGAASQTSTGDIMVTLPIPEEYYNYVRFAVYKLSPDGGTVTEVKGVEIQGDGKSVVFSADSLDTYVLATKANIAVRETNDDIYGTIGDIEIDTQMLTYIAYATIGVFVILIVVITLTGLRRRKFLNTYNKAHKSSLYKKGVQDVPKGNKPPREHPFKDDERVKTPKKPIVNDKSKK